MKCINIECNNSCNNNSCLNNDPTKSSGKTKIIIGVILILGLAIGLGVYFGIYYEKDFETQGIFYLSIKKKIINRYWHTWYSELQKQERDTALERLHILFLLPESAYLLFSRIWRHERHFDIQFTQFQWTLKFDPEWPQIWNLTPNPFFC